MKDIFEYKDNFSLNADIQSKLLLGNPDLNRNPKISIIIPTYKRPELLKSALESCLKQDFKEVYEILVVDNNDDPEYNKNFEIVKSLNDPRILYYRNDKNLGMSGNWNRGIILSRGKNITFCHDDDQLLPYSLSLLNKLSEQNPGKAIFASHNTINEEGKIINKAVIPSRLNKIFKPLNPFEYKKWDVFLCSPGFGCGCLFNRKNMIELGGFNEEFYPSFDYAFNALYVFTFGGVYSLTPTFNYRIFANESMTAYKKFADVDRHFRACMAKRMNTPKWILNKLIDSKYNVSKVNFAINWGKESKELLKTVKVSDKVIDRISKRLITFKRGRL